jgi:hypothetical protein
MRSQYGPETLLLSSKKPHIQDLLKRAENMTVEEIQNLSEKPDIIKGLLNIRRMREQDAAALRAEAIADAMMNASLKNN